MRFAFRHYNVFVREEQEIDHPISTCTCTCKFNLVYYLLAVRYVLFEMCCAYRYILKIYSA